MSRFSLATCCLVAVGGMFWNQAAAADGFGVPGLRSLARDLGLGFGQGYHAVPCAKHLAQHYNRSVQGITHPTHRLTPVYHQNTPRSMHLRGRRCERLPYFVGNTMPPLHAPMRVPTMVDQPYPTAPQPVPVDLSDPAIDLNSSDRLKPEQSYEDDQDDQRSPVSEPRDRDETEPGNDSVGSTDIYRIERLPIIEEFETSGPLSDVQGPRLDGSQFDNVELDSTSAKPRASENPLMGHPLWEENGHAKPKLFDS